MLPWRANHYNSCCNSFTEKTKNNLLLQIPRMSVNILILYIKMKQWMCENDLNSLAEIEKKWASLKLFSNPKKLLFLNIPEINFFENT